MKVVDLSHHIRRDMPVAPGIASPQIGETMSRGESSRHYAGGTSFVQHRYTFAGNSGTYLSSPFHRFPDGDDLSEVRLDKLIDLPLHVLDLTDEVQCGKRIIDASDLPNPALMEKAAVFIKTGWDFWWGKSQYFEPGPHLSSSAASILCRSRCNLVGIDSWNIDDAADGTRAAHTRLLQAGIPIVEHLCNLGLVAFGDWLVHAVPLAIEGGSSVPTRVYAFNYDDDMY